jgi:catechol 2,3-dioxygenase-like lactoylglutathione lyase family enzyme
MPKKFSMGGVLAAALLLAATATALAAPAEFHHVQITTSSPSEGVRWYVENLGCERIADRSDTAKCGSVELMFVAQPTMGSSQGTGIDHISFSFADLAAKMAELEKVGVRGSGVRFQRYPDGATIHDVPGLFKTGFIFDPWGTRIEMVQDPDRLGFHHVHLSAVDPAATLAWYRTALGGEATTLKGQMNGVRIGTLLVLAQKHPQGTPPSSRGRSIDHLGFVVSNVDETVGGLRSKNVAVLEPPAIPENARKPVKRSLVAAPDNVRIEVVETGFAGIKVERAAATVAADARQPYATPKTPWGEPDLQGIYTGNSANGIPLERPADLANVKELSAEQAAARRERSTLGSIWGYEREWRDTTLEYQKHAVSTQVSMIIDPPDGRLPPMTPEGPKRVQEARRHTSTEESPSGALTATRNYAGPEDLSPYVRCITRGLPGMMIPAVYNNGLQIVQSPGYVVITKEMIHEARVIPTTPREGPQPKIDSWLGTSQGRWEGNTLVVETTNFNGRMPFQGTDAKLKLTERYTRVGPNQLEYRFTVDDPTIWTKPWTAMFVFDKDDAQYELVEYACHETNYSMANILSGARADEKAAAKQQKSR